MSSGFWTGGPEAYLKGLKNQRDEHLLSLRDRLAQATDQGECETIQLEIKATQAEYEKKVAETDRMIF